MNGMSNNPANTEPEDLEANLRRLYFLRLKIIALPSCIANSRAGEIEDIINTHLYGLFHKIFERHLTSRYFNKAEACAEMPLRHKSTCAKYLDEARRAGYIQFERDPNDNRNYLIKPTSTLIRLMEQMVDDFTTSVSETIEGLSNELSIQRRKSEEIERTLRMWENASGFSIKAQKTSDIKVLRPIRILPKRSK